MTHRVAILQSSYVPWRGYFDLIRRVDRFLLFDEVQYTRRDWRNRNRIRSANGVQWLTIPVEAKGRFAQRIDETRIADPGWGERHFRTLRHAYARSPHWERYEETLRGLYLEAQSDMLSAVNRRFLEALCHLLGIETPIEMSTDYTSAQGKNERLIRLCSEVGATHYLSGPSARVYIDEGLFAASGIQVEWLDYPDYAPYPQLHGAWEENLSVLDLLLNLGPEAGAWLTKAQE